MQMFQTLERNKYLGNHQFQASLIIMKSNYLRN